ncbi:PhoPQ-activated protein PqaA family protein [Roseovarius pacificus]|uniref:PhoPQ-activated pathogenicity-related family protein n=1 Tax=Roseovarius pacificus TaxID=337701 RepID=UPI002A18D7E3|nr:PhoPQ-activated protein PqaA family protein [Roseovarius pacificus]
MNRRILAFALCLALALPALAQPLYPNGRATEANATALDRYVAAPDSAYSWKLVSTASGSDWKAYVLSLTSQRWRTEEEVDRPLWQHWLTVVVPDEVNTDTAILNIWGGDNGGGVPQGPDILSLNLARGSKAVAATLNQIPNQPLKFSDETRKRGEDSLIAYTWAKYMDTGDETWPLRLPMTKACVRAMDAVQEFCASLGDGIEINHFLPTGASKRGWATWTTAMVDSRVTAMAPMVIDLLNVIPSFKHHYAVYGFWAPAVKDYVNMDIMRRMDTPEYLELMKIIEPYHYLDRLTMPKFLVHAACDQFFLPDSARFYINDVQGLTYMRSVPNSGHSMLGNDAIKSLMGWIRVALRDELPPPYSWEFPDENTVKLMPGSPPKQVLLWKATNPKARDFRIDAFGKKYQSTPIEPDADGNYSVTVDTPANGFTAFLLEMEYEGSEGELVKFSTPVRIVPDVEPFEYVTDPNPIPGFLTGVTAGQ